MQRLTITDEVFGRRRVWGFVLLLIVVGPTRGELVLEVRQFSESQAWGEVRLRLDEEGIYFGDGEKFISW